MRIFDAALTAALLPLGALADAIIEAAQQRRAGRAQVPHRTVFPLADGDALLIMPASDERYACVKLVSVNLGNPARGLPRVQGEVVLMDRASGARLALFDGTTVTAHRTAAVSLAAARRIGTPHKANLLVVGAGTQGRAHARALGAEFVPRSVLVGSRNIEAARTLADELARDGVPARATADIVAAAAQADIIVTATNSRTPVLPEALRPGVRIFAVGAHTAQMVEVPAAVVRRARIVVDTRDGAAAEAGDLIQAGVAPRQMIELEDASACAQERSAPVLFKSVGSALWDLAAARLAWETVIRGAGA